MRVAELKRPPKPMFYTYQIICPAGIHLWRAKSQNEEGAVRKFRRDCPTQRKHPEVFAVLSDCEQNLMDNRRKLA